MTYSPDSMSTPTPSTLHASSVLGWRRAGLYMALTFSTLQLLGEVGAMMAIPLYPSMSADLGLTPAQVSWALLVTLLMGAVSTAFLAKVGDLYGHRRIILVCVALVVVGYVTSALATTFEVLLIGRALTGVVATQALFIAIMNDRLSTVSRNRAIGIIAGGQAVGITIGFGLGGAMIALGASWRTTFWVGGLLTLGGLLAMILWGSDSDAVKRNSNQKHKINALALGTVGLSLASLCVGIAQSTTWGLTSAITWTFITFGVVGLLTGMWWESRNRHPLVDMKLVFSARVLPAYVVFVALGIVGIMTLNLVMGWAQTPTVAGYGFGLTPLAAGLLFVPMTISGVIAGRSIPLLLARRPIKTIMIAGAIAYSFSCVLLYFLHSSIVGTLISILVYGLAFSTLVTAAVTVIATQAPADTGAGTASIYVSVALASSAVGTALYAAVIALNTSSASPTPLATNYSWGFIVSALVALIAVAAAALLPR